MTGAKVIYDAAQAHIKNFIEEFYEPNMLWLLEVHQNAKNIFNSGPDTLLPRTPGAKRKFVDVEKANACYKESTFHEGTETKKLKIDDLSTIIDSSIVELSSSLNTTTRSLRPRKQKNTQPIKRPRRITTKKTNDVKSIVISQDFIPPNNIDHVTFQAPNMALPGQQSTNSTLQIKKVQQSNSSAMKDSLHQTPNNPKGKNAALNDGKFFKSIKCQIDFEDINEVPAKNKVDSTINNVLMIDTMVKDSLEVIEQDTAVDDTVEPTQHVFASTPEKPEIKQIKSTLLNTSVIPMDKEVPVSVVNTEEESPDEITEVKELSPEESPNTSPEVSPKKPKNISTGKSPRKPKGVSPQKTGKSPPRKTKLSNDDEKENVMEVSGRRDTYRVMVDGIIDGNTKKPPDVSKPVAGAAVDLKKVPKVTKPVKAGGNLVTNVKSLLKRPGSPRTETTATTHSKPGGNIVTNVKSFVKQPSPRKEPPGCVAKKAAELEKKEIMRQNAVKEGLKKKQQQIEEKKRLREIREKLLAEQQQKKEEENEKRRKQLELKEAQMAKNQEDIRKARELEEKQKRELRDAKKAELDARRQKEEEESRRKAEELHQEEKRKREVMQKKLELDEQKRKKKFAEKELLEKDKLRLVEENRQIDEERKKKDFNEKEKHRLEVKKKKDEEREKDRLERQLRDEKNRQAEKEILEGKKRDEERQKAREEEKQRAKEKLREEIKGKLQHGYPKAIIDVPNTLRSSPRLQTYAPPKIKFNPPSVPLVQRDSMYIDYGIEELDSDDSTDDESQPTKRIPSWAVGGRLKKQLVRQFYTNIDPDDIFINCMEPLRLEKIFKKNKKIYFTRSSSAHWSSPPIKGAGYKYH